MPSKKKMNLGYFTLGFLNVELGTLGTNFQEEKKDINSLTNSCRFGRKPSELCGFIDSLQLNRVDFKLQPCAFEFCGFLCHGVTLHGTQDTAIDPVAIDCTRLDLWLVGAVGGGWRDFGIITRSRLGLNRVN
ncbi:TPA: hypothetical protein DEA21_05755 [Candidatus Uhrbacteria bacterium]|nr:hypothetical protein [Candidatus Uhrbacteria bacterium]HCU31113.1 hypothetical protein [Candidatus Uhrbacteria bacterium]